MGQIGVCIISMVGEKEFYCAYMLMVYRYLGQMLVWSMMWSLFLSNTFDMKDLKEANVIFKHQAD
jgi:hypothetical protein